MIPADDKEDTMNHGTGRSVAEAAPFNRGFKSHSLTPPPLGAVFFKPTTY